MLSIIICSREKTISEELSINIEKTTGCEYELIIIDNTENKYSIFEAYNLGIEKSTGDYLCFIHDDILFHTEGWGSIIQRIFSENKKIGLLGVAGAKTKTKMPSVWWDCNEGENYTFIIQHFKNKDKETWDYGFDEKTIEEVVVIDGVFMVSRKEARIDFHKSMKGFHNYDLNISFEYKKRGYKVVVTNQILIEHFSIGKINKEWIKSTSKIHKLYESILPLKVDSVPQSKDLEIINVKKFINQSLLFQERLIASRYWIKLFLINPFLKFHIVFWKILIKKVI
ncbi:glycosyltransferase [Flavobacterium sp. 11]|uniref:glycosyltransferase n=1 Tax=Flavobacterium sp. 11 TaxID=357523 RepID=UPI000C19CB38|nr:glycosyltransferase [Flavobacterium sp. 11]PIF60605.1 glycosyl transferase family 2 [Flavobacterium sp. 11]